MVGETDIGSAALQDGSPLDGTNNGEFPEGTMNKEKYLEQAHAEQAGRDHVEEYHDEHFRGIDVPWEDGGITPRALDIGGHPYGEKAGEDYEIRKLGESLGKTEEEIRERMAMDKSAMLEYGSAILANKRKWGEKLSLGEETFELLADFAKSHPEIMDGPIHWAGGKETIYLYPIPMEAEVSGRGTQIVGSFLRFGYRKDGERVSGKTEHWDVGPYRSDGSYKSEELSYEGSPGNETRTRIERSRDQTPADMERLKEILSQVPQSTEAHEE